MFRTEYDRAMAETAGHQIFQRVLPDCNAPPASVVVHSGNLGNARCSVLPINPNLPGVCEFRASRQHILHWRYKRRLDCALKILLRTECGWGSGNENPLRLRLLRTGRTRGRNHGVVQACGPTTRSLANTTFRRSHTMSAASKRATIIAWGTLDGMKTVVNVNQRAVFVSIRTGIMTARDWSARPRHPERIGRPRRS